MRKASLLEYAILGLLSTAPYSGYDVRKTFTTTPMRHFSDSPGSIYPALQRLEEKRWIRAVTERRENPRGRRRLQLTREGTAELGAWLSGAVDDFEADRPNAFVLRLSFMAPALSTHAISALVRSFRDRMAHYVRELQATLEELTPSLPPPARFALLNGIRSYEAQRDWADETLAHFDQRKAG